MAPTATQNGRVPIAGYDKLDLPTLFPQLRTRSQEELASIDAYERAHQDRRAVLDKLRYLRVDEPIEGYDTLNEEQVLAALAGADRKTLDSVRDYETRLRARPAVLAPVARLRTEALRSPNAPEAEPEVVRHGDQRGGILGGVTTFGVLGLMLAAGILMIAALVILGFLALDAVSPDTFIGN